MSNPGKQEIIDLVTATVASPAAPVNMSHGGTEDDPISINDSQDRGLDVNDETLDPPTTSPEEKECDVTPVKEQAESSDKGKPMDIQVLSEKIRKDEDIAVSDTNVNVLSKESRNKDSDCGKAKNNESK